MPPPTGTSVKDLIRQEAKAAGVPEALALSVADQESSFNPTAMGPTLKSGERAVGTFQLLPSTAKGLGVDETNPIENIRGGVKYLRQLLDKHQGDLTKVLREYGGVSETNTTNTYAEQVLGKLGQYQSPGGGPTLGRSGPSLVGAPPPALPPDLRKPGAQPASGEQFRQAPTWARVIGGLIAPDDPTRATSLVERGIEGPLASAAEQFDVTTRTGRRNVAGAVGGAVGTAAAVGSGGLAAPLIPILGAGTAGLYEELGEQTAGTTAPSTGAAFGAGAQQAAYEAGGQAIPWGTKLLAKRVLAHPVAKGAAEALTAFRTRQTARLADALDAASLAAGDVKEAARRAKAFTSRDVADRLATARSTAEAGVETARAAGATGVQRATDQATAAEVAGRRPFGALVGTAPTPGRAGRMAEAVIRGPAQEARDLAGQEVDRTAREGPMVDMADLKAEAQRVVDQVAPPERTFPRRAPDAGEAGVPADAAAAFKKQFGMSISEAAGDPRYKAIAEGYRAQFAPQSAIDAAQAEVSRESLKHPAMGVVNRILNADDQVPFHDLHLWKSQLQNALGSTVDQAVKKQVTSLTEHLTGQMRSALAIHEPYNEATANYARIIPLYTKEYAARFRRLAATDPDSLVRMITPGKPNALRMLRDLLVGQSTIAGKGAEGQAAWDSVRGAWARNNLLNKGVEGIDGQLARLPKEFHDVFFEDAHGQQVLQHLQQVSAAFKAATTAGEAGVSAAKASATSGVEAAQAAGEAGIEQTRRVGQAATEQAERDAADVRRQAGLDIRTARRAKVRFGQTRTPQEEAFRASSLGVRQATPEELVGHGLRALGLGPFQIWGAKSWVALLSAPQEKDLLEWAIYSPENTRKLVTLFTGPSPTGNTIAAFLRGTGILSPRDDRSTRDTIGQPPPVRR